MKLFSNNLQQVPNNLNDFQVKGLLFPVAIGRLLNNPCHTCCPCLVITVIVCGRLPQAPQQFPRIALIYLFTSSIYR